MTETEFNCPNCGASLKAELRLTKLVVCDHCESSVMIEDAVVRNVGKAGVMTEMPSILRLNTSFEMRGASFLPVGQARFTYQHGYWEEWWIERADGDGVWFSIDEGDVALEEPVDLAGEPPPVFRRLRAGQIIELWGERFLISETGGAVCEAVRGHLPERLTVGDGFDYVHLRGAGVRLITLEYDPDGAVHATDGYWIDPFDIKSGAFD